MTRDKQASTLLYCKNGAGRVICQLAKDVSQNVVSEDGSPKDSLKMLTVRRTSILASKLKLPKHFIRVCECIN